MGAGLGTSVEVGQAEFFIRAVQIVVVLAPAEQQRIDGGAQKIVGVTHFVDENAPTVDILKIGEQTEVEQVARLKRLKANRDKAKHAAALERIEADARSDANMMPALIAAAKADATVGEMMEAMTDVFGAYDGGPEW